MKLEPRAPDDECGSTRFLRFFGHSLDLLGLISAVICAVMWWDGKSNYWFAGAGGVGAGIGLIIQGTFLIVIANMQDSLHNMAKNVFWLTTLPRKELTPELTSALRSALPPEP